MLEPIRWQDVSQADQAKLLQRPILANDIKLKIRVANIIKEVSSGGDAALKKLTERYDKVTVNSLQVSADEFVSACSKVSDNVYQALLQAIQRLTIFHRQKMPTAIRVETSPGIICETKLQPIERVGLYIPGGSAPLVSTVLMLGVPAQIANCPLRILCSPPNKEGTIDPSILVAAQLCGIDKVYKVGGAQAIAAMAYGTKTIPKVDKIFGPGNSFVALAKMLVVEKMLGVVCDLPAGPSEVMVIADQSADPEFIAADLLSQAEHGGDSQVILICTSIDIANKTRLAIARQIKNISRHLIATEALKNSRIILVDTIKEGIAIANEYAPEHLILQVEQPRNWLADITCAGSIFLGKWSPESAGDYVSGTNHVLPTYGFARSVSGLSTGDFMKLLTVQELTQEGLNSVAWVIKALAGVEGLDAHFQAVAVRLNGENYD
jgi:histidinol dehydrogenase